MNLVNITIHLPIRGPFFSTQTGEDVSQSLPGTVRAIGGR